MEKAELIELLKTREEFVKCCGRDFTLNLISDKYNLVYNVKEHEDLHIKVGLRGWGQFEWEIIKILHEKKYVVPEPICFIPIRKHHNNNWAFGSLEQVDGVLICRSIRGTDLWQSFSLENLRKVIELLRKVHADDSIRVPLIENYKKAEIMRGLHYAKQFDFGTFRDALFKKLKHYDTISLKKRFIHGDARPDHFIFTNGNIGMIDFEGACMGDPIKDFGTLIAELLNGDIELNNLQGLIFEDSFTPEIKERFEFFMIRRLLVKMKYENSVSAKSIIINILSDNFDIY
ncbi:MAG: phosphotransferase family protein [Candidatus Helarchaeota archaeon]